jgi:carboxymethylenebutenolidase
MSERIDVITSDGPMPARLWRPAAGSGPGLLVLQEIFGVSEYIQRRASDLAGLGYVVLAPELFWRSGVDAVPNGPDMLEEAMAVTGRTDWDAAVSDARAALRHLRAMDEVSGGVGVVGFCYGGGLGYAVVAQEPADVLVAYYGSALPDLVGAIPSVSTPSLHHFGEDDSYIPMEAVTRIRETVSTGGGPVEFHTYPGADHAFDNDDFVNHHPEAGERAWATTTDFLARMLPVT